MAEFNFLGLEGAEAEFETAKAVILPIPYERTVSFRTGCSRGPAAIIDASRSLELYDEEFGRAPSDCGVHTRDELECDIDPESMTKRVKDACVRAARGRRFVVTLGGDHSVTVGAFSAQSGMHSELSLLSLDAHCDLRNSYQGSRLSHACVMRRIVETGARVTVAGARSLSAGEAEFVRGCGNITVVSARDMTQDTAEACARIVENLSDKVYLSIDADGIDPSVMPAVGTPEPGGPGWTEVNALLRTVFARREVVGMDLVELCPIEGLCAPNVTAARLIQKALGYKFCGAA